MQEYQKAFIEFAIERKVLRFGRFKLKSGRESPYFFNAGLFNDGLALARLGRFYAQAIVNAGLDYDVLFGPAYKGIPLAATTAVALATEHEINKPYVFNRKEAKQHGEQGLLVGAPLQGKALIVDDVITAGTAIREVMAILDRYDAHAAAVVVALDRQEKGQNETSAIQEIEQQFGIPVISVVTLAQVIDYLRAQAEASAQHADHLAAIERYRAQYGIEYC